MRLLQTSLELFLFSFLYCLMLWSFILICLIYPVFSLTFSIFPVSLYSSLYLLLPTTVPLYSPGFWGCPRLCTHSWIFGAMKGGGERAWVVFSIPPGMMQWFTLNSGDVSDNGRWKILDKFGRQIKESGKLWVNDITIMEKCRHHNKKWLPLRI